MVFWKSVVGKLWMTIMGLVALVLIILGLFLLEYIDLTFENSSPVKRLFIYACIIGFLLTTFFAFFLSSRITKPLIQMKETADLIANGDYSTRVEINSTDEIGLLANTLNHMSDQLEHTITDLNQEKEHLSSVLRSMSDAVMTFNNFGELVLANPKGEHLLREWAGFVWEEENQTIQNSRIPLPLRSLFEDVVTQAMELTSTINVHQEVWSVVIAPLYSNGKVRGAVAVLRDVTEEKRMEKMRKDFVANVSHELRTPLSMVQGYSEALLDDIAGSEQMRKELAQVIYDESLRMGRLVTDILDLARMESGNIAINKGKVDIQALVHRVYRKFSVLSKELGITLSVELENAELALYQADEDRLEQVMTNLVDNAIKHSNTKGSIYLRAFSFVSQTIRQEQMIQFEIEDNGQGIPAQDVPYIFERFYKADKARKRDNTTTPGEGGGTGLGLAIVKNIVEAHQGTIVVESKVGEGTKFIIRIPSNRSE